MKRKFQVLMSLGIGVLFAVSAANGQTSQQYQRQSQSDLTAQQKIASLEKELQSLKIQLVVLRAQLQSCSAKATADSDSDSSLARTTVDSGSKPSTDGGRPSEAEIKACALHQTDLSPFGEIYQIEFGKTQTAPGGTVFPVKLYFSRDYCVAYVSWDPFGKVQCPRVGNCYSK